MRPKTAYQILALPIGATLEQVENNFRKMAMKYHPDLHPDDPHAARSFKEVAEAYEVLSNRITKREYDELIRPKGNKFPRINYWRAYSKIRRRRK
jgi:curved DNA-binding protein